MTLVSILIGADADPRCINNGCTKHRFNFIVKKNIGNVRPSSCSRSLSRGVGDLKSHRDAVLGTGMKNTFLMNAVEGLFSNPLIFKMASKAARAKIVKRGDALGLDFAAEIRSLQDAANWEEAIENARDPQVHTPEYYKVPFHAYENGNLSTEAALEVTVAAKSVHSTVYSDTELDPHGDSRLRSTYSHCMKQLLDKQGARNIHDVLDIGAATGLSSVALLEAFPDATVTGIDLSPHFIAAGRILQSHHIESGKLRLVHGLAEQTTLLDETFDMVSMCLVCHELPQQPTIDIFKEAYRLLRPGGALCVMEMNPITPAFQRVMNNPIPYAIFKSTEPYLLDYVALDMPAAMAIAGFSTVQQMENSPKHKTVVAIKHE
eukprot:jgi/Picsp_1/5580/NSC_02939-R1_methyltransferase type 11